MFNSIDLHASQHSGDPSDGLGRIARSPAGLGSDWGGCVATVGSSMGCTAAIVLRAAAEEASRLGLPCVLVTFDPHPLAVVDPARAPQLLTDVGQRADLALAAGADWVYVHPFTAAVTRTSGAQFVADFLVDVLAVAIVVGDGFRFGAGNSGDVTLLRSIGCDAGFDVRVVSVQHEHGRRFSSTAVRSHVAAGERDEAERVLGRRL
jgi:riboflavin kinase/FMN adenylyltransferase